MTKTPVKLPVISADFEFQSIVTLRLARGVSGSFFDRLRDVFQVKLEHAGGNKKTHTVRITGAESDANLVNNLLLDVHHQAALIEKKRGLKHKYDIGLDDFAKIADHLDKAIPAFSAQRGQGPLVEKAIKTAVDGAVGVAVKQMRQAVVPVAFSTAAGKPAISSPSSSPQSSGTALAQPPVIKNGKLLANMPVITPRNISQAILKTALGSEEIGYAGAVGPPGGGKSIIPMAHAFERIRDKKADRVFIFRAPTTTSQRELGPVGGDERAKMRPYLAALDDNIQKVTGRTADELVNSGILVLNTGDLIRGATLDGVTMIVDEAHNYELGPLSALGTRRGDRTQTIFTGDITKAQSDIGLHEPGLTALLHHFIDAAEGDEQMAQMLAVVYYKPEDSEARSKGMSSVVNALSTTPKNYRIINSRAVTPELKAIAEDIEANRQMAESLSRHFSNITENKFREQAAARWPELFGVCRSNVISLTRN